MHPNDPIRYFVAPSKTAGSEKIKKRTQQLPLVVGIVVVVEIGQLYGGEVQHLAVIFPRLEAKVAVLMVERVPGDVDRTV